MVLAQVAELRRKPSLDVLGPGRAAIGGSLARMDEIPIVNACAMLHQQAHGSPFQTVDGVDRQTQKVGMLGRSIDHHSVGRRSQNSDGW
ncbi:MAG: hypothetical protein ACKV0T_05110 [Planctomycetales bacterium]